MNIEKMRLEFIEIFESEKGYRPTLSEGGDYFIFPYENGAWWAWLKSRESIVVQLPNPSDTLAGPSLFKQFRDAVEASGLKVTTK